MKECKNCGTRIPSKLIIDGKERVLTSRKYCFDCSPWNLHNTRKLEVEIVAKDRICKLCSRKYSYSKSSGHQIDICNSCVQKNKRLEVKKRCVEYMGGKCVKCKYDKCIKALHFHHTNSKTKSFTIAQNYTNKSWNELVVELNKCIILCSNCHCEIHDGF